MAKSPAQNKFLHVMYRKKLPGAIQPPPPIVPKKAPSFDELTSFLDKKKVKI